MNAILSQSEAAPRILVVDDDAGIRSLLSSYLSKHGYDTDMASSPIGMRELLRERQYNLIVLDLMMPGEDGITALRGLKRQDGPPVIMLSAVGSDIDRIVGLEMGADDYLAKPCNPRELLARIRTVLRSRRDTDNDAGDKVYMPDMSANQTGSASILHFSGWSFDLIGRTLCDAHLKIVGLSDSEFRLMRAFVEHPRRVLSRDQILDYSRGQDAGSYDRAIDVQVSRLRRKLSTHDGADLIRTVRSEGYMFAVPVSSKRLG